MPDETLYNTIIPHQKAKRANVTVISQNVTVISESYNTGHPHTWMACIVTCRACLARRVPAHAPSGAENGR